MGTKPIDSMVGAACAQYGSRTTIIIYNAQSKKVEQLTLLRMGSNERWIVTNPDLKIADKGKLFAPALRATYNIKGYMKMFEHYCL